MSTGNLRVNTLERTMEFICTTATAAEKLKRLAKNLRKTSKTSLAAALDAVAKQHGYEHWKHVTICVEQTDSNVRSKALPASVMELLDRTSARNPASTETKLAFSKGCVFAMDIKDALDFAETTEFEPCDDGWYLAAKDIWPGWIYFRDEETGTTLLEALDDDDLIACLLEDLQNYCFYRYGGKLALASQKDAYALIRQHSFFPPVYLWLDGKFVDVN